MTLFQPLSRTLLLGVFLATFFGPASAAPQLQQGAIVNAASFAVDGTPSAGIARGSLFTVFGVDIGPTAPVQATSFPLPLDLGGVTIKITAGGNQYDAVVLFAINSQVSAILPSAVPAGQASLVLSYNGQPSNAITFQVVNRQVGVFTRTQNGSGLAVLQNFISPSNQPVNTLNQSAQPGQVVILWGTGLGASLNADDRNAPAPGNIVPPNEVKVYVGGTEAVVEYAGRSGCCSGVDQINFRVPSNVEGCFVPVVVTTNGVPSNFTSMAISKGSNICNDPYGLSSNQLETLLSKSTIRVGAVSLSRSRTQIETPFITVTNTSDVGVATFQEYSTAGLLEAPGVVGNPVLVNGSCMVSTFRNDQDDEQPVPPELAALYRQRGLDAGAAVSVNGPLGARQLPKQGEPGEYFALLTNPLVPNDTYLDPGQYTVSNGSGGADVKAFSITRNVPSIFTWTNRNAITSVNRGQSLTVTWTPGNNPDDVAAIFGASYSIPKRVASTVFCFAPANAGTFTIPQYVLAAMVPSDTTGSPAGTPGGNLSVGAYSAIADFTADGLDVGAFVVSSTDIKFVNFQ